ncbi:MAG: DUF938 domain-containing protein [Jhaorihella sp.]
MSQRPPPEIHSLALPGKGDMLVAPSAERNLGPIRDLLVQVAPQTGRALELASGTGQHVVALAAALPGLAWQPSEPAPERRASIAAHVAASGLRNVAAPIDLDATAPGWGARLDGQALVFLSNLLHLIAWPAVRTLIGEAARALAPGGTLVIYGPFMRAGELTSDGDRAFHRALVAQNPAFGYKDDFDVMDLIQAAGLTMVEVIEMPANNLALVAAKKPT